MFKRNLDVWEAKGKIPVRIIAEKLGVHFSTLNGWLGQEMDPERKQKVLAAIDEIKKEMESMAG